jgi:hypothetical protein
MNARALNLAATLSLFAMLTGCGGRSGKAPERDDRQQRQARDQSAPPREWRFDRPEPATMQAETQDLPVEIKPTLVKQGPAPLVYLVETPGSVAVVDLNTQQRLASAPVPARTIVRVESRSGVIFGEQHVSPGPLPADHQFGIYLESNQVNQIRNETITPLPRGGAQQRQGQPQQPQQAPQPQTRPQ